VEGVKCGVNVIFVASPYKGNVDKNIRNAMRYCQFVVRQGAVPLAPHLLFPQFMDDNNERERGLGISFGITLLDRCDELWVFSTVGGVSEGMKQEIAYAEKYKIPIRYFNTRCKEVGS
jgi:hypothetical protein